MLHCHPPSLDDLRESQGLRTGGMGMAFSYTTYLYISILSLAYDRKILEGELYSIGGHLLNNEWAPLSNI